MLLFYDICKNTTINTGRVYIRGARLRFTVPLVWMARISCFVNVTLTKHVTGADIGVEQAENRVSGSGH